MTNNTATITQIRDAVYNLLVSMTGEGLAFAASGKFHPVAPDKYPFASVEPGMLTNPSILSNTEILRAYGMDILVQYAVPNNAVGGVEPVEYAWNKCMAATQAAMDALDTATNLGHAGIIQVTPSKPRPGKAVVGDGLCVFYIIEVAIETVFDKV